MNLVELPDNEEYQRDCAKSEAPVSHACEFKGCTNCLPTSTSTVGDRYMNQTPRTEAEPRVTQKCEKNKVLSLDNCLEFLSF